MWVMWYMVSFGLLSFAWVEQQRDTSVLIRQDLVPGALVLATVGLLVWTGGYLLGPPRLVARALERAVGWAVPPGPWALRTPAFPVVVYLVGMGGRILLLLTGHFDYLGDAAAAINDPSPVTPIYAALDTCTMFGVVLALLDATSERSPLRARVAVVVMVITELGFGLLGGMKGDFLRLLVALGIVLAARHAHVRRRLVVAATLVLLLVVSINASYREAVQGRGGTRLEAGAAAGQLGPIVTRALTPHGLTEAIRTSPELLEARLRQIDNLAIIVQRTPEIIPHRGGADLAVAPVLGVVPRALWPSKPVLSVGLDFSRDYYDVEGLYTSSATTIPGDLYRHLGVAGLLGLAVLGVACRLCDDVLDPRRDLRLVLLYASAFLLLINLETDVVSLLASAPRTLLIALLVTRIAFRRDSSTSRPAVA
jgi:hypothetical protein